LYKILHKLYSIGNGQVDSARERDRGRAHETEGERARAERESALIVLIVDAKL